MSFDAANFYAPSLVLADTAFGTSQILAGSDDPYFQGEKYVRAFSYIRQVPLPEKTIEAILRNNAIQLYGADTLAAAPRKGTH